MSLFRHKSSVNKFSLQAVDGRALYALRMPQENIPGHSCYYPGACGFQGVLELWPVAI